MPTGTKKLKDACFYLQGLYCSYPRLGPRGSKKGTCFTYSHCLMLTYLFLPEMFLKNTRQYCFLLKRNAATMYCLCPLWPLLRCGVYYVDPGLGLYISFSCQNCPKTIKLKIVVSDKIKPVNISWIFAILRRTWGPGQAPNHLISTV